jgi:uncharacterized protein
MGTFKSPLIISFLVLILAFFFGGIGATITVAILGVLEVSLSFDNAVINATVLRKMNAYWQKIFLTVGILIAVFGMRLAFPVIVVSIAAHLGLLETIRLAFASPAVYAQHLLASHATIAAFGGTFLSMIFLDWVFEDREIKWLTWLERPLARIGEINQLSTILIIVVLLLLGAPVSGFAGLAIYLVVNAIGKLFNTDGVKMISGGLITFLYLELIDASFSFDGVNAAFAVTSNIILIAIGLGIGALFIRTLTIYLVNRGVLDDYRYLEHGAHWAIGMLAALLLVSIFIQIPQLVTGLLGVLFIGASFGHSLYENQVPLLTKTQ